MDLWWWESGGREDIETMISPLHQCALSRTPGAGKNDVRFFIEKVEFLPAIYPVR